MDAMPPKWLRVLIAILLACNVVILYCGLTMDFLTVQKTISAWGFAVYEEENTVSILSGVMRLREEGKVWLAGIVFIFSVLFPICKLVAAVVLFCAGQWSRPWFAVTMGVLTFLGKWSALDLFAGGVLVVYCTVANLLDVHIRVGFWFFAAAVILSIVVSWLMKRATCVLLPQQQSSNP